jgi:hypothetical protein
MLDGETPPAPPTWTGSYRDLAADLDLGPARNSGPPYVFGANMTLSIEPDPSSSGEQYAIQVVLDCWNCYSTLSLEAVSGPLRQVMEIPWVRNDDQNRGIFEGILDLRGWPTGLVNVTAYAPDSIATLDTRVLVHVYQTAVPGRLWPLYGESR